MVKKVSSVAELKKLASADIFECRLLLVDGCAFSRKEIYFDSEKNRFRVYNYLDDTRDVFSVAQFTERYGKAIAKGALVYEA
jgi:hypothetical protein